MSDSVGSIEPASTPRRTDLRVACGPRPQLLVSIRSADEAAAAMTAAVDLLDVKEPRHGSLGRPTAEAFQAVVGLRDVVEPSLPVSLALGELAEWSTLPDDAGQLAAANPDLVKLGLRGMGRDRSWRNQWSRVRGWFDRTCESAPRHVAVAYADWRDAEAPEPVDVIAAAIETNCAGVLFDTCGKRSGGLLTHLTVNGLRPQIERIHAAGLFVAIAGQLQISDLALLSQLPIDVIAVRSAVCTTADRNSSFSAAKAREFKATVQHEWSLARVPA